MSDVVNAAHNDGQNQVFSVIGVIGTLGTADTRGTAPTLPIGVNPDTGAMYVDVIDTQFNVGTLTVGTINRVGTIGEVTAGSITVTNGTINRGTVYFGDSTSQDAFGRLKVSQPEALFDNMAEYGDNPFFWENKVNGNGTVTSIANNNAIRLSTGGTINGHYAYRATKAYMRYQPGRSLNIETTFVLGAAVTDQRTRIGYFDAQNGLFLQRAGTTVSLVRRTNVTGTATDNPVAQSVWNVDPMTGSGPSGKTIDWTKSQIMFIQLQYLGVGRVQVGFVIDGIPYVVHQFLNTNSLTTVYMSTGCLPVRGEVENTSGAGGTGTLDMICTSVSTGGRGNEKIQYSRSNGITGIAVSTTLLPILSIRAGSVFGGTASGTIPNRGRITPKDVSVLAIGQAQEYQILLNPVLTGGTWVSNGTISIADYDVSATAVSGGTIIEAGYIAASNTQRSAGVATLPDILPLVYSGLNNGQDILAVCARTNTGNGTAYAAITWQEEY